MLFLGSSLFAFLTPRIGTPRVSVTRARAKMCTLPLSFILFNFQGVWQFLLAHIVDLLFLNRHKLDEGTEKVNYDPNLDFKVRKSRDIEDSYTQPNPELHSRV